MRSSRLLAVLLASSFPAFGQQRQTSVALDLLPTYSDIAFVDAENTTAEIEFAVDAAAGVDVWVLSGNPHLSVALIDPGGALHPVGQPDSIVQDSTVLPSEEGAAYAFLLADPPSGMWKCRVSARMGITDPAAAILTMTTSSEIAVGLLGVRRSFVENVLLISESWSLTRRRSSSRAIDQAQDS